MFFLHSNVERPEQVAVNQHVYQPQQYGQAFQDLTSYVQKLQQQGLVQPIGHYSQPFVLPHNSHGYVYPSYPTYQVAHEQQNVATAPVQGSYHYQPNLIPNISLDYYGKHKVNHNENLSSHVTIGHYEDDKKPIIKHLNATIHKVGDKIEHKVNAIKVHVENSVQDINKLGDDVYKQVGDKVSKIFDSINKKLEKMEHQLHYARSDDESLNVDELEINENGDEVYNVEDMARSLLDEDDKEESNVVDSETGTESVDAEMRTGITEPISNALKKAQEKFNNLIEMKVTAVNRKIAAVNSQVENVFNKLQAALEKLKLQKPTVDQNAATTPMPFAHEYTTIQWKPTETAWQHQTQPHVATPAYYQYTVPPNDFFYNSFKSNIDGADLKRMDENVDNLELTDDVAKSNVDDATKPNENNTTTTETHPIVNEDDAKRSNESELKNDDDLQTQIVENLKDTLKSDDKPDENNEADIVDNTKSENLIDEQEKSIDSIVPEELRTDNDKLSEMYDEKIDNDEKLDELRNFNEQEESVGDEEEEEEMEDDDEEEPASVYNDYVKSSGNDENDEDDNVPNDSVFNEMRSIGNAEKNVDNEDDIPLDTSTQPDVEEK